MSRSINITSIKINFADKTELADFIPGQPVGIMALPSHHLSGKTFEAVHFHQIPENFYTALIRIIEKHSEMPEGNYTAVLTACQCKTVQPPAIKEPGNKVVQHGPAHTVTTARPVAQPTASKSPIPVSKAASPTAQQIEIITAPAHTRSLVIAGPGTGKTYTLLHRLQYLILKEAIEPRDIVVLSFSRAAVREVKERLEQLIKKENFHEDLIQITVRTFDSFAYQLLNYTGQTPDLLNSSYEDTIARATHDIKDAESEAAEIIAGLGHVVVDEVQDLVGRRAALVQSILNEASCGFTIFGDPAQAIYDYQVREDNYPEELAISSVTFLKWLRDTYTDNGLAQYTLSTNMRASGNCFWLADRYREKIVAENSHVVEKIREDIKDLVKAGSVERAGPEITRLPAGWSAAILCRTNNEALHVHNYLEKQNIPHVLATDANNSGLPAWIGRIFSTWIKPDISKEEFEDRWRTLAGKLPASSAGYAWDALLRIMEKPSDASRFKIKDMRQKLLLRPILPDFSNRAEPALRVSTVHRAKGREFDQVILLSPLDFDESYQERIEEARVFYVGCTRPRKQLLGLERKGLPSVMRSIASSVKGVSWRGYAKTKDELFIETGLSGDVDELSTIKSSKPADIAQIQTFLWETVRPGDPLHIFRVKESYYTYQYYIKTVRDDRVLGKMSSSFIKDMNIICKYNLYSELNSEMVGVRVADVRTIVTPDYITDLPAPYCDSGMFLSLRVEGVLVAGRPKYENYYNTASFTRQERLLTVMISNHQEARKYLVDYIERDLTGPASEEEVLNDFPVVTYIAGILFPQNTMAEPLEEDEGENADASFEEDIDDTAISLVNTRLPSAIGMTFMAAGETPSFQIEVKAAVYIPVLTTSAHTSLSSVPLTPVETFTGAIPDVLTDSSDQPVPAETTEKSKTPKVEWKRQPISWAQQIEIPDSGRSRFKIYEGLNLELLVRQSGTNIIITATLVNRNQTSKDYTGRNTYSFFQPQITVRTDRGNGTHFVARENNVQITGDEDVARNRLLYRHYKEYAVGHGCAAMWDTESELNNGKDGPETVYTRILPSYEIPRISPLDNIASQALDMLWLSQASVEELSQELRKLTTRYQKWIEERERELTTLSGQLVTTGKENIKQCKEALVRINQGITLLQSTPDVREAFQLASLTMNDQRRQKLLADGNPDAMTKPSLWRPFQLCFILLNIFSVVDPHNPYRDTVDLLWFPTGGGKTEAYLGLAAFTILLRRIRASSNEGYGVTILMRYTLRLLTIQQFQRASTLICALELERRKNPRRLGTEPISIGMWVGGGATPNTIKEASEALKNSFSDIHQQSDPVQLLMCPWCNSKLSAKDYQVVSSPAGMLIKCNNVNCEFKGGLPVYLVDEDIYRVTPTLLIGTVDKFARLPWKKETGRLFGKNTPYLPPELIIQDELHLISGPLGTLVGLYETVVDLLCLRNGVRPKVIASTATIRRAAEQNLGLFNRRVEQFPPSGLEADDSFFALAEPLDKMRGRLYVGVMATGSSSAKTTMLRIYAALLQGVYTMDAPDYIRDPYWTLVGYFNSLRELGGAVRLVQDDVRDRLKILAVRETRAIRKTPDEIPELTSNLTFEEVRAYLERMKESIGHEEAFDVLLATNMISVGVDVDRLGLMVVAGQPKTTAEYIQATSRVGRQYPGLVVTSYNPSRPRDRSHYERFRSYHATVYSQVEATSVTPFSQRARDRGLHGVLISLIRHTIPYMMDENAAIDFRADDPAVKNVVEAILSRVIAVDPAEEVATRKELELILKRWESLIRNHPEALNYGKSSRKDPYVMYPAEENQILLDSFPTLNSLREVEPSTGLSLPRQNR